MYFKIAKCLHGHLKVRRTFASVHLPPWPSLPPPFPCPAQAAPLPSTHTHTHSRTHTHVCVAHTSCVLAQAHLYVASCCFTSFPHWPASVPVPLPLLRPCRCRLADSKPAPPRSPLYTVPPQALRPWQICIRNGQLHYACQADGQKQQWRQEEGGRGKGKDRGRKSSRQEEK